VFIDLTLNEHCWKLIPGSKLINLKRSANMQLNRLLEEGPTSKKPNQVPKPIEVEFLDTLYTLISRATTV
jgi:hypothetical protein